MTCASGFRDTWHGWLGPNPVHKDRQYSVRVPMSGPVQPRDFSVYVVELCKHVPTPNKFKKRASIFLL
jgi:hypothetical protein